MANDTRTLGWLVQYASIERLHNEKGFKTLKGANAFVERCKAVRPNHRIRITRGYVD
jgi:hypothetical protein